MAKKSSKLPTPAEIAHQKFLKKMGVLPKQIKQRKKDGEERKLKIDTIHTMRRAYDCD